MVNENILINDRRFTKIPSSEPDDEECDPLSHRFGRTGTTDADSSNAVSFIIINQKKSVHPQLKKDKDGN